MRSRRKNQRGAAIIEGAFVMVKFFTMLVGIFDLGRMMFIHQALTERVRSAARWGAANGAGNSSAIRNQVLYGSANQPENATGYFGLKSENVTVTQTGVGTNDNRLTVSIKDFKYKTVTPFFAKTMTGANIQVTFALGIFN